ncbi:MAG: NAD(P)-dependent alcohol dehydrogenase [Gammaproteobacteria bacterium]|nr:MAG: NAD(P)-dependent alcohol dehydrogenase [Gammaproteobacteria bacterium]
MKAAIYHRYGGPEVLSLGDVNQPEPGDDELLIETHAAEVTKADCEMRRFSFPVKWFWLPLRFAIGLLRPRRAILGGYFSGVVVTVGKNVSRFRPGDAIFGTTKLRFGAHGEFLCLPQHYTLENKPDNISFEEAAAVPLGGLNAIHFMRKAGLQPGESILINGAGGSIGTFALQIAKLMGAEVTAVDHGDKADMLRGIGADHVIDYMREDFTRLDRTYDVIFDMVATSSYSGCVGRLKPGGRYLIGNPRVADMLRSLVTPLMSDKQVYFEFAGEGQAELHDLAQMLKAGEIRPVVDRVYPLEQIADAHRRVETEARLGIVVVSLKA